MEFREYIKEYIKRHPSAEPCDVIKACYQAAMGAEHLLGNVEAAKKYFFAELESAEEKKGELFDRLSDDVCRVDMRAWKAEGMPPEWLFKIFLLSAQGFTGDRERLSDYISKAESCFDEVKLNFSMDEWRDFLEKYKDAGMPAVHHSESFRQSEKPSYRIIKTEFLPVIKVLLSLKGIKDKNDGEATVIAIDGRAASGKSTLAKLLSSVLDAEVVHMDDFFLPLELRSDERLSEAGGNIHYERFAEEVLPYVRLSGAFEYGVFDCGEMKISSKRTVEQSSIRIVEGSYSTHPVFERYADLCIFCTVTPEEQMRRIIGRDGERWARIFGERWIPMEEKYFSAFDIKGKADIVIAMA